MLKAHDRHWRDIVFGAGIAFAIMSAAAFFAYELLGFIKVAMP